MDLAYSPCRFGWYGIGYSYAQAKNTTGAVEAFKTFLHYWASADPNLANVVYAKNYINNPHFEDAAPQLGCSLLLAVACALLSLFLL